MESRTECTSDFFHCRFTQQTWPIRAVSEREGRGGEKPHIYLQTAVGGADYKRSFLFLKAESVDMLFAHKRQGRPVKQIASAHAFSLHAMTHFACPRTMHRSNKYMI